VENAIHVDIVQS